MKKLLQQALDALEANHNWHIDYDELDSHQESELHMQNRAAIEALRAAIAQGESEPHYEEQPDGSVIPVDPSEMCAQPVPEGMVLVPIDPTDAMKQALDAPEMHDALCPALTGGKCACSESPTTVDKAWSQFCGGIGRGPDAPYPGMIEAFEAHYGQSFTDKDWRNETGVWAAAWGYAVRQSSSPCKVEFHTDGAAHENTTSTP